MIKLALLVFVAVVALTVGRSTASCPLTLDYFNFSTCYNTSEFITLTRLECLSCCLEKCIPCCGGENAICNAICSADEGTCTQACMEYTSPLPSVSPSSSPSPSPSPCPTCPGKCCSPKTCCNPASGPVCCTSNQTCKHSGCVDN
jgi:hypothetical protein